MQHCPSLKAMATANDSSSSSSSGEGVDTSSSCHSSSDSKQETAPPKNTPVIAPASAPPPSHKSQVHSPSPNVKPKPIVEISKTKTTLVSSVKTSAKRPSETHLESAKPKRHNKKASAAVASEQEVKKGIEPDKVNKGIEEDANKQPQFQRVFSEEDEITLLKGMFDYLVEKGSDASADMNGFYDFIKNSIQTEVTKVQLSDKIKRLKKRFKNNQGRVFKHPSHEQQIFELSKKIWGKEGTKGKIGFSASLVKDASLGKSGLNLFDRMNAVAGMEGGDVIANFGLDTIGAESRAALEKKLLKLRMAELELLLQHNELINKKIKFILENYMSQV